MRSASALGRICWNRSGGSRKWESPEFAQIFLAISVSSDCSHQEFYDVRIIEVKGLNAAAPIPRWRRSGAAAGRGSAAQEHLVGNGTARRRLTAVLHQQSESQGDERAEHANPDDQVDAVVREDGQAGLRVGE